MIHKWNFKELPLRDAYIIDFFFADDIRGGFAKDYSQETFAANGIRHGLKEVFYTISHKGVIRALHFQRTKQQAKLVRCVKGKIYDVIVDLRKDSPTFKQWMGFYLSGEDHVELLVPKGFAHGYLVLEESIVSYKCDEKFFGEFDGGIKFDDPEIGVDWPFDLIGGKDKLILAEKDICLPSFAEFMNNYEGFLE